MKIVDKYGLAECEPGTPFFVLNNRYWKSGKECFSEGGTIDDAMRIKISDCFYSLDGKPMFNGVARLEIDNYDSEGQAQDFTDDTFPEKIELVTVDEDSNDYDDNNRFLILSASEFRDILDELEVYYLQLKETEHRGES